MLLLNNFRFRWLTASPSKNVHLHTRLNALRKEEIMKILKASLLLFLLLQIMIVAQDPDAEGCKDHPLLNRMKGFHISSCETRDFDVFDFPVENSTDGERKVESVEGKKYYLYYNYRVDDKIITSRQILKNFETALNGIKATVYKVIEPGNSYSFVCGILKKGKLETWVHVTASDNEYEVNIVEKEVMKQEIQATDIYRELNETGFIALDIHFDIGKSTIKAESQPIIDALFDMLKSNPDLKVSIEGHTDNTGNADANKKLSIARAQAVMDALIKKGIAKTRLTSTGFGQEVPVADNRTEDGKAKNRRVEIVKK